MIKIKPMSVNVAWRGGKRFRTNEYKDYERVLLLLLPMKTMPKGNLELNMEVGLSNKNSDIDNFAKPFIDILQKAYEFNDNRIYKLTLEKRDTKKGDEYISFRVKNYA